MNKSAIADREVKTNVDSYRMGNRKETSSFESHKLNKKQKIRKADGKTFSE